jgi:uncharacterized protein YggE
MRIPAALALPLALAACQPGNPDPRGVAHDETLLTVTATGRADSRPDEARLQLGVQSIAASAGEASRLNRDKMQKVSEALTGLGVKPDDLQTRNLSLQRIDYGADRGRFRADNVLEVTLRDVARVGDAVTAVTEAGANVMSGPDLRVSDREAASRSAYASTYRAARARAEAYAGAAGLKIDRILGIYDGGEYGLPVPQGSPPPPVVRNMSTEQASSAPFSAGMNSTEVRVRVDFALEAK